MWWIVGRHAQVDLQAQSTVWCHTCGQVYDALDTDPHSMTIQGHDLCAWSRQLADGRWVIHCGYQSEFDQKEFWYIDQYPSRPVDGICDWCIRRMLRDGVIIDPDVRVVT
jgi:hypothetical protein